MIISSAPSHQSLCPLTYFFLAPALLLLNWNVTPSPVFTNFWLQARTRLRKKNAQSCRSWLRHAGFVAIGHLCGVVVRIFLKGNAFHFVRSGVGDFNTRVKLAATSPSRHYRSLAKKMPKEKRRQCATRTLNMHQILILIESQDKIRTRTKF